MDETRPVPRAAALRAPWRAVWRPSWWLMPGLPLLLLVFLTVNVVAHGPLLGLDRWIRDAVQAQANSAAWRWVGDTRSSPAQILVDIADNQVAIPVLAVCAMVAVVRRQSLRPLLAAGTGLVLLLVTVIAGKVLIGRPGPGPTSAHIPSGGLGVFPSGHTTRASVCYVLSALLLAPEVSARLRRVLMVAAGVLCFVVGLALIWCNYHWFTDVVAGWALAAIIIQICLAIAGPREVPARSP
jgi:membrane-associated phospholipid phosphatase